MLSAHGRVIQPNRFKLNVVAASVACFIGATAGLAVKAPPPMTLPLAQDLVKAYGQKKGLTGLHLNEFKQARIVLKFKAPPLAAASKGKGKNSGLAVDTRWKGGGPFPIGTLYFTVTTDSQLRAYVSVYQEPVVQGRREHYFDRINAMITSTNLGGGQLIRVPEAETYYIGKSWRTAIGPTQFLSEVAAMELSAAHWINDLLPDMEQAAKRKRPIPPSRMVRIESWRLE